MRMIEWLGDDQKIIKLLNLLIIGVVVFIQIKSIHVYINRLNPSQST